MKHREPAPGVRVFLRGTSQHRLALALGAVALAGLFVALVAPFPMRLVGLSVAVVAMPAILIAAPHGTLHVGTDGLRVNMSIRPWFLPWDHVTGVAVLGDRLRIARSASGDVTIQRIRRGGLRTGEAIPLGALGWDIENALARHRAARDAPRELESRLRAPTDGGTKTWLGDVRALASDDAYRSNSAPRSELVEIVETSSDPTARVAAALALRWLGPTQGERSRVAAARVRVADPALGAALDASLDGDDRAAERAALRVRARAVRGRRAAGRT